MFNFVFKESICGQVMISLAGRVNTGADQICVRLQEDLKSGRADINIEDGQIVFIYEGGVSFNFAAENCKLSKFKKIMNCGILQMESFHEGNFSGFQLSESSR